MTNISSSNHRRRAPRQTSVHLGYVLGDLPLTQRFVAARKLGFDSVEFPFPFLVPAADYATLLADNDLKQISIGTPTSDYRAGEPGYSLTPAMKAQFDRSVDTVIEYAKTIRCTKVHVFSGPRSPNVSPELAMETYCRNLAETHDKLAAEGLTAVIEPVNSTDFPGYFIDRIDRALEAIARAGRPSIQLILDVYHAHVNREDPLAFLQDGTDRVSHIQLADYPGRHEPGSGTIDFSEFFATLDSVGYRGSIGLEYVPTRSVADGVPLARQLGLLPEAAAQRAALR